MHFKLVLKQQCLSGQVLVIARVESSFAQQDRAFKAEHCGFSARPIAAAGEKWKVWAVLSLSRQSSGCAREGTTCNSVSSTENLRFGYNTACVLLLQTRHPGWLRQGQAVPASCSRWWHCLPGGTACASEDRKYFAMCFGFLQRACDCEIFSPADYVLRFVDMKVHMSLSSF